jgi:hypothetical protein
MAHLQNGALVRYSRFQAKGCKALQRNIAATSVSTLDISHFEEQRNQENKVRHVVTSNCTNGKF